MLNSLRDYIIGSHYNSFESYHDKSRITLLYRIALFVLFLGVLATIISLIVGTYAVLIPSVGNIILSITALSLVKFHSFQLGAKVYFFTLFILLFGNLIFNYGTMHVGSPFWVMLLNILVFYILGRNWGIIYIILSSIGFGYYVAFVFPITIEIVQNLPTATYYSALYETVFVLSLLGYVLSTILGASIDSDRLLKESNSILKDHNDTILESYKEKTVLLKEVHHRVKNNLQVIVSLMRLQMRNISENGAEESYHETINRVLTMSKIHEKIYQSESLSQVNLEKYFHDLSTDLISSYQTEYVVKLDYSFEVERVGLQTIVPLALIFNELFSNSLKHAFHQTKNPIITLFIKSLNSQTFSFTYEDNGGWKESKSSNSLGMELIDSLTSQLDGELIFTTNPNTKYEFIFKMLDE